jgi:Domain of unknown function (DUF3883)
VELPVEQRTSWLADYEEMVARMKEVAGDMGLDDHEAPGGIGWLFWPRVPDAATFRNPRTCTRGVGVFKSGRGLEFNFAVLRDRGQGEIASELIARLGDLSELPLQESRSCPHVPWPQASSLLEDWRWRRTLVEVIEPYFRARLEPDERNAGVWLSASENTDPEARTTRATGEGRAARLSDEGNHLLLVAATAEPLDATDADFRDLLTPVLEHRGMVAYPWRRRLLEEKKAALAEWPYLYLYAGVPVQALVYRMRVASFRTTADRNGTPCPWPDFSAGDYLGWAPEGTEYTDMFKTWFLIDEIVRLEPNIPLRDLLNADGSRADPWSLVPSYGLWRLMAQSSESASPEAGADIIEHLVRGTATGQGLARSAEARRATERHAVEVVRRHYQDQDWAVEDVSDHESYDLLCTKGGATCSVEVKGITGSGGRVIVTANEVRSALQNRAMSVLAVVHGITLASASDGSWSASGGKLRIFSPWRPDSSELEPIAYWHTLVPGPDSAG